MHGLCREDGTGMKEVGSPIDHVLFPSTNWNKTIWHATRVCSRVGGLHDVEESIERSLSKVPNIADRNLAVAPRLRYPQRKTMPESHQLLGVCAISRSGSIGWGSQYRHDEGRNGGQVGSCDVQRWIK